MATKNIKGITIEIGGNTTKLQDALKDVDKQVYSLNGDLKALSEALKLNPKNTELLAQKHEVLERNIKATTDRLNTLKEAQRQMGDYNHLTDEQKASYNQLSLEIAKSESALKDMKKELLATSGIDMGKLKDGLKKVGEVALDVTKKLAQVTTAVSGALAGVVALGVKSYADFEQNLGGVETLFGKDADLLIQKSKEAYKTAGVSANEYMAGVTSFSASLLQSLGGDTAKAVEISDMAFRDMSDNANKFGTDMQSVQSAYQGFAKGQYQLLDNLKLGYGGTKTEMERLLKDAEKISGVKYDIKNLSDVYEAIHVIQEELGVTGTTMEEAESTISGSMNMVKASFDNFLNGSGSPEDLADAMSSMLVNIASAFDKLLPSIVKGISKLVQKLVPLIGDILSEQVPNVLSEASDFIQQILNMIIQNQTPIAQTITMLINEIIMFLTQNLPKLVQAGISLIVTLAKGIVDAIPTLAEALPQVITTILNVLVENIPAVLEGAIQLLMALVEAIPVIIEALVDNLPSIIDTIITTLIDNIPMLLDASIKLFMALVEAIPTIVVQLVKAVPTIIASVVKTLWDNRGKILEAGKKVLLQIRDGIVNNLSNLSDKIKELPSKIKDWCLEGLDKITEIGKNIVEGVWKGMENAYDWIYNKIKEWVGNVLNYIKKKLGISSPSKVMADSVGKYMAEGIGVGFENEMDSVEDEIAKALPIDSLVGQVNSAMRGLNQGIQTSINPQVNPNISLDQNYKMMAEAMKEALSTMEVSLDDRELGKFVTKTITEEIYQ